MGELYAYPPTYGASCTKHFEPGHSSCFDVEAGVELPIGERAAWCDNPWCYVDPCDCNIESTQSERFEGATFSYTYAACNAEDAFSTMLASPAVCVTATNPDSASSASGTIGGTNSPSGLADVATNTTTGNPLTYAESSAAQHSTGAVLALMLMAITGRKMRA